MIPGNKRRPIKLLLLLTSGLLLASCGQAAAPQSASTSAGAPKASSQAPAAPKAQASSAPASSTAASGSAQAGANPIRIGMIAERTGPLAMYGEAGLQGVQLAADELNAQGGLLGRKIEVTVRDSKGQQDESVRQARDLLLNEKVDFLISNINSAECLADSQVAKEAKKIYFSSCGVDDLTTTKFNHYTFRVPNINTRTQGQAPAVYAAQNIKNFKTVYTIANDYSAGHSNVDFFKARLKALKPDVQFVGESWPKLGETDYTSYITAIQNAKPDLTYYFFATAIPFFNQAAPVKLSQQTKLVSAYWGGSDEMSTLKQDAIPQGAVMGGFPWYGINTPENQKFVDTFRAKYNKPPIGPSYFQYLTMQFLSQAIKKAGSTDTEKVISALEGMQLNTIVGPITLRAMDHQGATPLWMGNATWDAQAKQGRLIDLTQLKSDQFLPTEAEFKKMQGQ